MGTNETREQSEAKLEFFKRKMTDAQLRTLVAFARGMVKKG